MNDKVEKSTEHHNSANTTEAFKPGIRENGEIYHADLGLTIDYLSIVPDGIVNIPTPKIESYISDAISVVKYVTNGMVSNTTSMLRSKVASSMDSIIHSGLPALSNFPVISDLNWLYPIFKSLTDSKGVIDKIKIAMKQAALFVARLPLTTTGRVFISAYFQHLKLLLPEEMYAILDAIGEYSAMFSSWLSLIPDFSDLDVGDLSVVWLALLVWSLSLNASNVTRLKTFPGKAIKAAYDITNWLPSFFGWLGLLNSPVVAGQLNDSGGKEASVTGSEREGFAFKPQVNSGESNEPFSYLSQMFNHLQDPLKFPTAMATDQQSDYSQADNIAVQQNEVLENAKQHLNQSIDHFISALRSPERTGTLNGLSLEAINELKSSLLSDLDFNKELSFRVTYNDYDPMDYVFEFTGHDVNNNTVSRSITRFQIANFSLQKEVTYEPTIAKYSREFTAYILQLTDANEKDAFERSLAAKSDADFDEAKMYNIISEDKLNYLKENPAVSSLYKKEIYFSPGHLFPYKKVVEKIASALYEVKKIFQFSMFNSGSESKFKGLTVAEINDFLSATNTKYDWGAEFNLELQLTDEGFHLNTYAKDKSSGSYEEETFASTLYFTELQPGYINATKVWSVITSLINQALPSELIINKYIVNDDGLIKLTNPIQSDRNNNFISDLLHKIDNGRAGGLYLRNSNVMESVLYRGGYNFNIGVDNFGKRKSLGVNGIDLLNSTPKSLGDSLPELREAIYRQLNSALDVEREYLIGYLLDNGFSLKEYAFLEEEYLKEIVTNGGLDLDLRLEFFSIYGDKFWKKSPVLRVKDNFNPQGKANLNEYLEDIVNDLMSKIKLKSSDGGFELAPSPGFYYYPERSRVKTGISVTYPKIKINDYKLSDKYAEAFGLYDYNNKNRASDFVSTSSKNKWLVQKIINELKDAHNVLSKSSTIQAATALLHDSAGVRGRDLIEQDVVGEYYKLAANQINQLQEKKLHEIKFQREFIINSLMHYLNIDKSKYKQFSQLKIGVARETEWGDKPFNRDVSFMELIYNDGLRKAVGASGLHPLVMRHFKKMTPGAARFKNTGRVMSWLAGFSWENSSAEVIAEFLIDANMVNESDKQALTEKLTGLFGESIDTNVVPGEIASPIENFKEHIHSDIDRKVSEISDLEAEKILLRSPDAQSRVFKGNINYFQSNMSTDAKSLLTNKELTGLTNKMDILSANLKRIHDNTPVNFYNDLDVWTFKDYKDLFIQLLRMLPFEVTQIAVIINDIASGAGVEQISEDFIFLLAPFLDEFRALDSIKLGALLQDAAQLKILADSIKQVVDAWKNGNFEALSTSLLSVGMSGHGLLKSGARLAMPRKYETPFQIHDINGEKFVVTNDVSEVVSYDAENKPIIRKGGIIKPSEVTSSGEMTFSEEWAIDEEQVKETYECESIQVRNRKTRGLDSCLVIQNTGLSSLDFDTNVNPLPVEGTDLPQDTEIYPWGSDWKVSATKVEGIVKKKPSVIWVLPYEGKYFKAEQTKTNRVPQVLKSAELPDYKLPKTPVLYSEVNTKLLHRKGYSGHLEINQLEKNLPDSKATLPVSILPRKQAKMVERIGSDTSDLQPSDPESSDIESSDVDKPDVDKSDSDTSGVEASDGDTPKVDGNQDSQVIEDFVMNYGDNWYFGTKTRGQSESTAIDKMTMKSDDQLSPEEKEAKNLHATLMSASFHRSKLEAESFNQLVAKLDSHPVAESSSDATALHNVELSTGEKYLFDKKHRVTLQKMHRVEGGALWESYDSENFTADDNDAINYNRDIMEALYPDFPDFDTSKGVKEKKNFLKQKNYVLYTAGDESFLVVSGDYHKDNGDAIPQVFRDTMVGDKIPDIRLPVELSGKNNPGSKGKTHYVTFVNPDPELKTKTNILNENPDYPPVLPTAATPEQLGEPVLNYEVTVPRDQDSERMLAAFLASSTVIERGHDIFVFNRNDACKSCAALLETIFKKARAAGTTNIRHVFVFPYDKY